jgi:hypothetical protein
MKKQGEFAIYERRGQVYSEIVADVRKQTLIGIIKGTISDREGDRQ